MVQAPQTSSDIIQGIFFSHDKSRKSLQNQEIIFSWKNELRKQKTGTPDVITPRLLNWFGCHGFHTSSTKIYEMQFYYSDLHVVNCYE